MAQIDIVTAADATEIAGWLANRIEGVAADVDAPFAIAVPGGSTPFPIIAELVKADLPWQRITIWPTDDRVVPDDHDASNIGKLRAAFASTKAEVVSLTIMEQVPPFALVWLGMGADGHIASLFPNTDPKVEERAAIRRLTPEPLPPEAPFDRVTLTMPSLLDTRQIVFTLGGSADKRAVFEAAMAGKNDLPIARLLAAADQPVTCFV